MSSLPRELNLSRDLVETAPLVRAALSRLHGRAVLITTATDVPITNGRLVVTEVLDGATFPTLTMEFDLRGVVFAMEIPLGRVFALAASWTGDYFVFRLPPGERLWVGLGQT